MKTANSFPLFSFELDVKNEATGRIAVSCHPNSNEDKGFLFNDLAETKAVEEKEAYRITTPLNLN